VGILQRAVVEGVVVVGPTFILSVSAEWVVVHRAVQVVPTAKAPEGAKDQAGALAVEEAEAEEAVPALQAEQEAQVASAAAEAA
jgi:hypothetical protein